MNDLSNGFFITECPDCGEQYTKETIGEKCPICYPRHGPADEGLEIKKDD